MKRKKFLKDLRSMSDEQLKALLEEFEAERTRFSAYGEAVGLGAVPIAKSGRTDTMRLRSIKKAVARIKTVLRERELRINEEKVR